MPIFQRFYPYLEAGLHVLFILLLAWAATVLVRRLSAAIERYAISKTKHRADAQALEVEKNVRTVQLVVSRALTFLIWAAGALAALKRIGIDTTPILTGAGVVGLAVGFGAQTLIKDVIAGLFLLIENQIRVGDTATINTVTGSVAEVNLRTTVLRAENGALHYFPNGSITALANLSIEYSIYVLELVVAPETSVSRVVELVQQTGETLRSEAPFSQTMLAPVEVQGVDKFLDIGYSIRIRIKTTAGQHYQAGRELNARLLETFRKEGIEMASRSVAVRTDPRMLQAISREDVKRIVKEVLSEPN